MLLKRKTNCVTRPVKFFDIEIIGSWKITTPAGVLGDSGTIPGTVSKAREDCAG